MKNNESINYSEKEKSDYYIQKSFDYNRKKLKNERRILEIIFNRVNLVRKKMGPEWAYWDMKKYIQDWLNKNKELFVLGRKPCFPEIDTYVYEESNGRTADVSFEKILLTDFSCDTAFFLK